MPFKISNVIGSPFQLFVTDQIATRAIKNSKQYRTLNEVLFLGNKTAWVRLQSSVAFSGSVLDSTDSYFDILKKQDTTEDWFSTDWTDKNLPSQWVLQSGTSKWEVKPTLSNAGQLGVEANLKLRSGIGPDGAYGLGGIKAQGYRPMPGLTGVNIETKGKLGSLRYATINFKVWNMNQLDVIDALYFRLGFTMLLEWGHTQYFADTADETLVTNVSGIGDFYKTDVTKEEIQQAINRKVFETRGNYDGMLGVVTNFNYSLGNDGGWDCSIKLIGLGTLMDTQRITSNYKMPPGTSRYYSQLSAGFLLEDLQAQREAWEKGNEADKKKVEDENKAYKLAYEQNNPILSVQGIRKLHPTSLESDVLKQYAFREGDIELDNGYNVAPNSKNKETGIPGIQGSNNAWSYYVDSTVGLYIPRLGEEGFINPLAVGTSAKGTSTVKISATTLNQFSNKLVDSRGNKKLTDYNTFNGFAKALKATYDKTFNNGGTIAQITSQLNNDQTSWTFTQYNTFWPINGSGANQYNYKFNVAITGMWDENGKPIDPTYTLANQSGGTPYFTDFLTAVAGTVERFAGDYYFKLDSLAPVRTPGERAFIYSAATTPSYDGGTFDGYFSIERQTDPYKFYETVNGKLAFAPFTTKAIKIAIAIKTDVTAIIEGIRDDKAVQKGGEKTFTPTTPPPTEPSQEALDATAKAGGFESALQAMLTIIQFQTLKTQKRKAKIATWVDLKATVGQFLTETDGAPLAELFGYAVNGKGIPEKGVIKQDVINKKLSKKDTPDRSTDPVSLGIKGYNTSLMSNQVNVADIDKNFDECYPKNYTEAEAMFSQICKSYCIPYDLTNSSRDGSGVMAYINRPVYINLGFLLFFINNLCLLYDTSKGSKSSTTKAARPFFYVDFNPNTNFCFTMPHQMSVDPTICMVEFKGGNNGFREVFTTIEPADLDKALGNNIWKPQSEDQVSILIAGYKSPVNDPYQGRTMNILLSVQHLLDLLKSTTQADGHGGVYFKPFLDAVLRDVNKAMGDMNALRIGYIDASNTVAVFDDQIVPSDTGEDNFIKNKLISANRRLVVPVMGIGGGAGAGLPGGIVRDFKFETEISTRMSSLIAIGASPSRKGSAQATEASHIRALSSGIIDRIITVRDEVNITKNTVKAGVEDNNAKLVAKFNEFAKNIYTIGKIDNDGIDSAKNYLIQSSADLKAGTPATNATPIIPLNVTFTMDGISGIMMGNGFLLPDNILPITIRPNGARTKFGFVVVKLDHKIENNEWLTTIKGQMVRMKDVSYANNATTGYGKGPTYNTPTPTKLGQVSTTPCQRTYKKDGTVDDPGYDKKSQQVAPPDYIGTDNFKKHYPNGFVFKPDPTRSDMDISKIGLTTLTEAEIVDDTKYNLFNNGAFRAQPKHFVFHHAGGVLPVTGLYSVYYCRGYPAQYAIARDGTIHRFLPDGSIGWHIRNAIPGSPYPRNYSDWNNSNTIGVEIMAKRDSDVLPVQLNAAVRLAHYYGFKKDEVMGHGWVNWKHKEVDEGLRAYNLAISL